MFYNSGCQASATKYNKDKSIKLILTIFGNKCFERSLTLAAYQWRIHDFQPIIWLIYFRKLHLSQYVY